MSSAWRYGYDTVLMQRRIQGETLYMCEQFGVDGKLYVGVIWTSALWRSSKIKRTVTPPGLTFHLQGLRMILTECEVCGVKSVESVLFL